MDIQSKPFTIPRKQFARAATLYFIRKYGMLYGLTIALGILLMIIGHDRFFMYLGLVMAIYPLTVPLRYANAITIRAKGFLDQQLEYTVDQEAILVTNEQGGTTRAMLSKIRDSRVIDEMLVLLFGRATFLILPLAPLEAEESEEFLLRVRRRGS